MKHIDVVNEFREELVRVSSEVEVSSNMGHFDINKICEDLFCGLFKEIYGFKGLRNLNEEEKLNFPGIDLADDDERVAIQVTSDRTIDKVKSSIQKFIKHKLNKKYDRLIVYVITKKQGSYTQASIDNICAGLVDFDASRDILDFTDLASKAANVSPTILSNSVKLLHSYTRGCDVGLGEQDFDPPTFPSEVLSTNLVELYFPQTLYIADIIPEALETTSGKQPKNQRKNLRKIIEKLEISLPSDYEINAGKLITFHNLENSDNPFSMIIDQGTVEPLSPTDFYEVDKDYERVFKSLLRFCLQNKLWKHRVLWQFRERLFIFLPKKDNDDLRKESWIGQKKSSRMVFQRKYNRNDSKKVLSTRHFAFSVDFLIVKNHWFISITPDWFFSYGDSYKRSSFGDKLLSGLKRMEKNRAVFDQFRFVSAWLRDLDSDDLFNQNDLSNPTITFGITCEAKLAASLDEWLWDPLKTDNMDDFDSALQRSLHLQ